VEEPLFPICYSIFFLLTTLISYMTFIRIWTVSCLKEPSWGALFTYSINVVWSINTSICFIYLC